MWIELEYHPGFSEDLTSWQTTIELDGTLNQTVSICRFSPIEKRKQQFCTQLSSLQLGELKGIVDETKFTEIAEESKKSVIDDAAIFSVTVTNLGEISSFSAPVDWWSFQVQKGQGSNEAIESALKLWEHVSQCSPFKGNYENQA